MPLPLLLLEAFGSLGWGLKVGRLEVGRGLGRLRAKGEFLDAVGEGSLVVLLIPEVEAGGARRSLEAAGRKREGLISGAAARLSLDCDGRRAVGMPVDLGMGRREVGRGRALVFPAWSLFSSIVWYCSASGWVHHKAARAGDEDGCGEQRRGGVGVESASAVFVRRLSASSSRGSSKWCWAE